VDAVFKGKGLLGTAQEVKIPEDLFTLPQAQGRQEETRVEIIGTRTVYRRKFWPNFFLWKIQVQEKVTGQVTYVTCQFAGPQAIPHQMAQTCRAALTTVAQVLSAWLGQTLVTYTHTFEQSAQEVTDVLVTELEKMLPLIQEAFQQELASWQEIGEKGTVADGHLLSLRDLALSMTH
jgi:hypothetical protein